MSDGGDGNDARRLSWGLEASSLADVKAAIQALDLGRLRWAVRSLPLEEALTSDGAVVACTDLQLKADLGRLGNALADHWQLDDRLARRFDPLVVSMLLAPHGGPETLIASYLVEDPELPPKTLAMIAAASTEPKLKIEALCRLFRDLDADVDINLLIQALRTAPDRGVNDALLAARPRTVVGCELHMVLMAERLDRTRWIPHRESFIELVEAWAAIMQAAQPEQAKLDITAVALLRGMARTWVDQHHWRAASIASLAQLVIAPDAEALGRAVFEASTIADWPLLEQAIDAAIWVEDRIAPDNAEYFLTSVTPTVGRLRARGDDRRADVVVGLAEACAEATDGPLSQRSLDLLDQMRETMARPPRIHGLRDVIAQDAMFTAVWGHSELGSDTHRVMPRVSAAEVLRVASDAGSTRRQGPLCLLLLADLAIEFGDLARARDIVEQAYEIYPRHSTVLAAQRKLAAHTGDDRRTDEVLDELARLWASERDDAGVHAQMRVLVQLHGSRGGRLVEMRARRLLYDPRFRKFHDRLEHLQG